MGIQGVEPKGKAKGKILEPASLNHQYFRWGQDITSAVCMLGGRVHDLETKLASRRIIDVVIQRTVERTREMTMDEKAQRLSLVDPSSEEALALASMTALIMITEQIVEVKLIFDNLYPMQSEYWIREHWAPSPPSSRAGGGQSAVSQMEEGESRSLRHHRL